MDSDARTTRLIDARRRSAALKRRHTLRTVDAVRRRGDRVTFAAIAREAAVSGWFVRNQPDVRDAIERAIRERDALGTPDKRVRAKPRHPACERRFCSPAKKSATCAASAITYATS